MNKTNLLTLSGLALLGAGIILLLSESIGITTSKILVPAFFAIASIFTFLFSQANKQNRIARQFHLAQSIGLLTFTILIAMIPQSLASFLSFSTYFIMFFGLFEIIFIFSVLNTKTPLNKGILLSRLAAGATNLIGGFILLLTLFQNTKNALTIAGILIIIGGIGFLFYAYKINNKLIIKS